MKGTDSHRKTPQDNCRQQDAIKVGLPKGRLSSGLECVQSPQQIQLVKNLYVTFVQTGNRDSLGPPSRLLQLCHLYWCPCYQPWYKTANRRTTSPLASYRALVEGWIRGKGMQGMADAVIQGSSDDCGKVGGGRPDVGG